MKRATGMFLTVLFLVLMTWPGLAQRRDQRGYDQQRNNQQRNNQFYGGVRDGGRGGNYYNQRDQRYNHDRNSNSGGIGPGYGALIGGGGGAALGAVFGGGLKGTLIGGAAGAGIGAIVGKVHQDNKRNDNRYRR